MSFSLRNSVLAHMYYAYLDRKIIPVFEHAGLNPNQLSLLGLCLALMVPLGFLVHPVIGLIIMLASGMLDSLDGLLARRKNQITDFGAFLDSSLDRFSDTFYLAGFLILFENSRYFFWAALFVLISLASTLMISYVKARAQALGVSCKPGLMERGTRFIFLALWALIFAVLPQSGATVLWSGLSLYFCFTTATVVERIRYIQKQMS
ncbi:MAG: CDP-alcohol phosphatidyltransferase family protein [Desulfobacteraceae bacterium]|nr:CDP-alcohol phosphatidyltransferase family protein [Desulfobacteraceae bacterium]